MRSRARATLLVTTPLLVLVGACEALVPPDPLPSDGGATATGDAATDVEASAETSTPPPADGGADASGDASGDAAADAAEPCPNAGALDCATSGTGRVSSFVVDPMKCASPKLGTKGCENWCAQRNQDANPDAGASTYKSTCVAEPDAGISGAYRCSCSTN